MHREVAACHREVANLRLTVRTALQ